MKFDTIKTKISDICRRIGRRNFIIVGATLLIGAAICLNFVMMSAKNDDGFDYETDAGMKESAPSAEVDAPEELSQDAYFSSIEVSRRRTRDEAIEVLQSVIDNQSATETAKTEALNEINNLTKVMQQEADIETLVMAKGFENCVAVISEEKANVVVTGKDLLPAQISQINEIVYDTAGILPVNVNITGR